MATYFIADLHFGHKNILSYDNRPFMTIEEHDAELIRRWNSVVEEKDDVWVLGDVSWYSVDKTIEVIKQLKGRKHLCVGNHDAKFISYPDFCKLFVEIVDYKELDLKDNVHIVLSHYPIPCFKNHFYGWYHLYGHVHNSFESRMMEHIKLEMEQLYGATCEMYNVGCMMPEMDYTPRQLYEIID